MDQAQMLLLTELPGLESARRAIEARIDEIRKSLSVEGLYEKPSASLDPNILGRDVLGRIVRKRNISPELKEKKRRLAAIMREKKAEKEAAIRASLEIPQPPSKRPAPVVAPVEVPAPQPYKTTKRR